MAKHRTADQISEDQDREIKFEDIVVFVEKQARAASDPVFGDISARSWDHEREKNTYSKPKGKSFQIKGDDADQGRSNEIKEDLAGERNRNPKNCPKCTRDHYLHDCTEFKKESSEERAQFVRSKTLLQLPQTVPYSARLQKGACIRTVVENILLKLINNSSV